MQPNNQINLKTVNTNKNPIAIDKRNKAHMF